MTNQDQNMSTGVKSVTFQDIVTNGIYYNPAYMHYNRICNVKCDRCYRQNLVASIGYLDQDMCLKCVDSLVSSSFKHPFEDGNNSDDFTICTLMEQDMFRERPQTRMEQDMFRKHLDKSTGMLPKAYDKQPRQDEDYMTFMEQDMFMTDSNP